MDVLHERCCGLDVHKRSVVACIMEPDEAGRLTKTIRIFGTTTPDLLELVDWLTAHQVKQVAMEATGSYWRPLYNLLEDDFTVVVVNAQHIKAVPGRKTDVKDCEWIAELLRHGLLRASFVPARPQRELRDLTRYRTTLVRERAAEINRLQKTLEGANIKLASVASNVVGASGRAMLEALVAGEGDPEVLAQLARGRLREKLPHLERALAGCFGSHHRFLIARQLAHVDFLDEAIAQVSDEVAARLEAEDAAIERLDTIPGVGRRTAEVLVAEIGVDVSRFPTAGHLASWAGMCPGQHESAGKRRGGKTRKGSPWLRAALVEAAQAAGRTKQTYLGAQYQRLAARRGRKKAAVAVGHTILVIAYHLLRRGEAYADLGANYFDDRDRQRVERRLVGRLERLGYKVALEPVPA